MFRKIIVSMIVLLWIISVQAQEGAMIELEAWETNILTPSGDVEAWDGGWIFTPDVIEHEGTFYLFYTGFNVIQQAQPFRGQIGVATSTDGYTWEKHPEPVLSLIDFGQSPGHPIVWVEDGEWVMYLTEVAQQGLSPFIWRATAASPFGPWEVNTDPVLEGPDGWNSRLMPRDIVKVGDEYRLYYAGFNWRDTKPQFGVAFSDDGIEWTMYDDASTTESPYVTSDPIMTIGEEDSWNSAVLMASSVLQTEAGWEAFYLGSNADNESLDNPNPFWLGYISSEDGIHWQESDANPLFQTEQSRGVVFSLIQLDDTYLLYHDDWSTQGVQLVVGTVNR